MKRLVLTFAALATVQVATAAEDVEFKWNGDFKANYKNQMNRDAKKDANGAGAAAGDPSSKAYVEGRFRLNVTARKGEHVQAGASLIHANNWGQGHTAAATSGNSQNRTNPDAGDGIKNANSMNNNLMVNRAWGWWKSSDALSFTFGRQAIKIADGLVFSDNDTEQTPTSHDGLMANWDMDMMKLGAFAVKNVDPIAASATAAGQATDPQRHTYGLSLDMKGMPEMIKMANLHFALIRQDEGAGAAPYDVMLNYQHLGLTVAGEMSNLTWKLTGAYQMGKSKANGTTAPDVTLAAHMVDLNVGYGMPETMGFKVWAGYHMDTGDKDNTTATNDKNESYQTMYYERAGQAGLMDVVRWGNLNYFKVGASVTPMTDLEAGVQYYLFNRSEASATSVNTTFGSDYSELNAATTKADAKELGSEIDLYANMSYTGGMKIGAFVGMYMPGAALKDATVKREATITMLGLQGSMSF